MFWRNRKRKTIEPSVQSIQNQITELQKAMEQLKEIQKEKNKEEHKIEYHFHIDQLDIHQPTLDQLSFQLDNIDVEELSGALNVGNNFGVSIGEKKKRANKTDKEDKKKTVKKTKEGYSISFTNKEDNP